MKIIPQILFRKLVVAAFMALISTFQTANGAEWMKLGDCRYVSNGINDGDSFMIKNRETTYVFRLYWVDTPEEHPNYPERVQAQADYFGIATEEVMQIGREATLFTRAFLKGHGIFI